MKKHLIAAAALATLSTAAFAQSATVYGIIDQSIWSVNNTNTADALDARTSGALEKKRLTSMESGAWMPSLWGITGTEDLGGGLKAKFVLESNLNSDTGVTGSLFDRQSWVGLSGGYGELRAGNQIDALFLQAFVNNVRLAHSNSAAVMGGLFAGTRMGTNNGGVSSGSVFSPNTLTYITPTVSGFKATLQRQMGETAGSTKSGSANAFLVNYDGIANLSLSAGTKSTKTISATDSQTAYTQNLIAAVYKYGSYQFNAQRIAYKAKEGLGDWNGVKYTLNELGVGYSVTPALTAAINYVDVNLKGSDGYKGTTDVTSISLKYALSKRTSLWTMASRTAKVKETPVANDGQAFLTPAAPYYLFGGSADSRSATTGYGVGVTHSF